MRHLVEGPYHVGIQKKSPLRRGAWRRGLSAAGCQALEDPAGGKALVRYRLQMAGIRVSEPGSCI